MEQEKKKATHYEDLALKAAVQAFGDLIAPKIGIREQIKAVMPTEAVYLEMKQMYEDFNYELADGRWIHFEFQSRDEGETGLKRFREYEAVTSRAYNVEIVTYVRYSGNVKNPMTELTEGINTYRVKPIIMQEYVAEEVFADIQSKKEKGQLTIDDLSVLALVPLMGGKMPKKSRIMTGFELLRDQMQSEEVDTNALHKLQSVLYAMASKFLDKNDLEEVKEVVRMTVLGEMIRADGVAEGKAEGKAEAIIAIIRRKLMKGLEAKAVAELLEISEEYVARVSELLQAYPEESDIEIARKYLKR